MGLTLPRNGASYVCPPSSLGREAHPPRLNGASAVIFQPARPDDRASVALLAPQASRRQLTFALNSSRGGPSSFPPSYGSSLLAVVLHCKKSKDERQLRAIGFAGVAGNKRRMALWRMANGGVAARRQRLCSMAISFG